jgi:hypothetical protein
MNMRITNTGVISNTIISLALELNWTRRDFFISSLIVCDDTKRIAFKDEL